MVFFNVKKCFCSSILFIFCFDRSNIILFFKSLYVKFFHDYPSLNIRNGGGLDVTHTPKLSLTDHIALLQFRYGTTNNHLCPNSHICAFKRLRCTLALCQRLVQSADNQPSSIATNKNIIPNKRDNVNG